MSIGTLIKRLQDIMRNDAGVGGDEQRLTQIVWLLFLAIFDAKEEEDELLVEDYNGIIPEGYRWRDWAKGKSVKEQLTGDELLDFVNNKLFKVLAGDAIKDDDGENVYLFSNTSQKALLVKEFMKDSSNYMKNGVLLRQVINEIDKIDFSSLTERHAFNDVYEQLLKGLQKNNGEFFTGRALTSLAVSKVNPKIGEMVADFACGTGGFLTDSIEYVKEHTPKMTKEQMVQFQNSFFGVEKKAMPYRLCVTNLLLHGIEEPDIMHGNTLETNVRDFQENDKFDVILMNPPYGGSELESILRNFPADLRNSETADLFMIEIMYRLKKNGRCAVILPDGFMFGIDNSKSAIKKKLVEEFNLHTVLRLPGSCFAPYTSIATNMLFFDNTEEKTDYVWFYRYDLIDGKKFSMSKNPMTREKFTCIDEWWDNRVEIKDEKFDESMTETWKSKRVSVKEIADANYSLDFCGYPNVEKVILSPEETINNFKEERERLDREMDRKLAEILALLNIKEG